MTMGAEVKERPILFSAPMVRAILAGTKTQTRRVVKHPALNELSYIVNCGEGWWGDEEGDVQARCPHGAPGDLLWVREAWRVGSKLNATKPSDLQARGMTVEFEAGGYGCNGIDGGWAFHDAPVRERPEWVGKLRPSIHMPRWASRITLRVTDVRVERLQDISNEDARAEGVLPDYAEQCVRLGHPYSAIGLFRELWGHINGPGSWDANPWVWVVGFERV